VLKPRSLSLLAGLLVSLASPALADEVDRGIRAYDAGEIERAEKILRAAVRSAATPALRARAWLFLGLAQASRRDLDAMRGSFQAALFEDPEVAPDRERVAPEVVAHFEAVRAGVTGEITVTASEPGARVFVDGRDRGAAPVTLMLPVGRHAIRVISADTYRADDRPGVLVHARTPTRLRGALRPRLGRVRLDAALQGAQLSVDGRAAGRASDAPLSLPAGPHRIVVHLPGFERETRDVTVPPEGEVRLALSLRAVRPHSPLRRAFAWATAGLAGAAAITAVLVGRSAQANEQEIREVREGRKEIDADRYALVKSAAERNASWANVFWGLGGAAAVTSLVLFLTERRDAPRAVHVVPTGAGAAVAVRW
jgi:hypothetical protein